MFAIVQDGKISNIIVATAETAAQLGAVAVPDDAAIGDDYDAETGATSRPPIPLATASAALVKQIDEDTDALYAAVIGNRAAEYTAAETEATAFADGGYTADPAPASVASWATAKGWTAQAAADDIIATATAWRTAQAAIRAARLLRKEQARTAADLAALATTRAQWAGFVAAVRAQLGV